MAAYFRKLAAILHADVVRSTELVQLDETLAHSRIQDTFRRFSDTIRGYGGVTHELRGDALVAEFARTSDAVSAALAFQIANQTHNRGLADAMRPEMRAGISLGEVVIADGTVTGAGVVLAQRLEQLASAGGVVVQGNVSETVPTRLPFVYQSLGEQTLKGFDHPVRAFAVSLAPGQAVPQPESVSETLSPSLASPEPGHRETDGGSYHPSIAVLPFANMSGDPEQEFFVDGLTEDLITELSRFHELLVISRNSTFVYKGKSINIPEVAKELNAQFVLEGSVRKAGNRVRITAQLIDAEADRHLWAERYDRELEDIFALQDEMTAAIAATLPRRIEAAAYERVERKPTDNMAAYECVLKAKVLHHRFNPEDNKEALELLDKAIALDGKYAHAHAWRACVLGQAWSRGWADDRDDTWKQVLDGVQAALSYNEGDSDVHRILAAVNITRGNHERAAHHQARGLSLNPNNDLIVVQQGELLTWLGQAEEGIEWIRKAMRLNPHHPERFWSHLGRAYFVARRYAEAVEAFNRVSTVDHILRAFLAASYAEMGDDQAASAQAREVLAENPAFTVESYLGTLHYHRDSDRDHHRQALLKSGLPAGI